MNNSKATKNSIEIGQTVPNFEAVIQYGDGNQKNINLYKIIEQGQKVLLVFYPKDNTPGCTKQLCGITDTYSEYKKRNIEVIGVNQGDKESHMKFINDFNFPFGIVIDTEKKIAKEYGAIGSFFGNEITKRSVFLIDENKSLIYKFYGQQDNQKIFDLIDTTK